MLCNVRRRCAKQAIPGKAFRKSEMASHHNSGPRGHAPAGQAAKLLERWRIAELKRLWNDGYQRSRHF
jgi:hypothetical protein